jgi:hypothetical protein
MYSQVEYELAKLQGILLESKLIYAAADIINYELQRTAGILSAKSEE